MRRGLRGACFIASEPDEGSIWISRCSIPISITTRPQSRRISLSKGEIKPTRSGLQSWYALPCRRIQGEESLHDNHRATRPSFYGPVLRDGQARAVRRSALPPNANRLINVDALVATIEGWFASMPSDEASMAAMKEYRVPHAPVLSVEEAVKHPHLRQRGTVRTVHDRILGDFDVPGFSLRFSEFPQRLELDAPIARRA